VRLAAAVLAVLALALAAGGAAALVADADAADAGITTLDPARRLDAADAAVRRQPWNAGYRLAYARLLLPAGDTDPSAAAAARGQFQAALRLAPADPAVWLRWEEFLARTAPGDPALALAAGQLNRLAPNEPNLQVLQADLAVRGWHLASPALQAAWLENLHYAIQHDRGAFLLHSFRIGEEDNLCRSSAQLGLDDWCELARKTRTACLRGPLDAGQAQWCRLMGAAAQ
jgi:hypothetical protein